MALLPAVTLVQKPPAAALLEMSINAIAIFFMGPNA